MNFQTRSSIIVKLLFNSNPLERSRIENRIKRKSDQFYNSILRNKAPNVLNATLHFFVFQFGIKPFVLKKGDTYAGVRKHWEKRNIKI